MTILSELFPLKIRSIASGIATAISNVLTFGAIRTYYDFEEMTSMQGALLIYTVVGAFGLVQITCNFIQRYPGALLSKWSGI